MLTKLLDIDATLFNTINDGLSSGLLDFFLVPIRYQIFWIPLYLFFICFILFNSQKYHWATILVIVGCVGVSDLMSSHTIKPLIERPRPCHENSQVYPVNLRVRCGAGYSFTSSHATNHFALATILYFVLFKGRKRMLLLLMFWAAAISFAQVYVGVHYPIDIACGAMLGISIAFICYQFYHSYTEKIKFKEDYDFT